MAMSNYILVKDLLLSHVPLPRRLHFLLLHFYLVYNLLRYLAGLLLVISLPFQLLLKGFLLLLVYNLLRYLAGLLLVISLPFQLLLIGL